MTEEMILSLTFETIKLILILSAPMLISALLIGLIISIFQATTQIQEQTLAFVPKIIVIFIVIMLTGSWVLNSLIEYTNLVLDVISEITV